MCCPTTCPPGSTTAPGPSAGPGRRFGERLRAGEYAAHGFAQHRTSPLASVVARSAARMGDLDNSLRWLHAATEATRSEPDGYQMLLSRTMDQSPDFAVLRGHPDFERIRSA